MASKGLVHVTDTLHIIPLPQNVALKHSWVILLPGQQHSQDFRPYVHTKASRGGLRVSWSWILFSLLHWSYDLVAVALLSASTVTYNDRGQDAA